MDFVHYDKVEFEKRKKMNKDAKRQEHINTEQNRRNGIKRSINELRNILKLNHKLSIANVLQNGNYL